MLRQYLRIKQEYQDAILLFRLGDFYEMFFEDAQISSKILDITLTSRNKNDENPIPLCGVPYHSVEPYIAKLLENGKKVAICEQTEDPAQAKGVVKREVTRIYTPGVIPEGDALDAGSNTFVAAVYCSEIGGNGKRSKSDRSGEKGGTGEVWGLAYADISTGLFRATECADKSILFEELRRIDPREIVVPTRQTEEDNRQTEEIRTACPKALITPRSSGDFEAEDGSGAADRAAAGVNSYLKYTQKVGEIGTSRVEFYSPGESMLLDDSTKRNLELTITIHEGRAHGSLLWLLNHTRTAMGARLLKEWLLTPLNKLEIIKERHDAVEFFASETSPRESVRSALGKIADIERLTTRMSLGTGNARDMQAIARSIASAADLAELVSSRQWLGSELVGRVEALASLRSTIEATVSDDPPISLREGGMVREGVNAELDELRAVSRDGKSALAKIEAKERERTGIATLKVRYNKVFGYYLEVTNAHRDKVPEDYVRKQTLTNAERYITQELKAFEEKVLGAEGRIKSLEYEIIGELRERIASNAGELRATAGIIAKLDVLASFAEVAVVNRYCRPTVTDGDNIFIEEGRHPVVEKLNREERFVPNDVSVGGDAGNLIMITGPNMAGKSTVMRQTALIVLMAQIGSFVPAAKAEIGIADRIFTRIGASDALARGQSTFMVEMTEAATILREATKKSLIIIDEIGRGTSTFDGLAIAWSMAEELHDKVRARTLFATHYHELAELAATRSGIRNFQIAVKEWNDKVIFLRRLVKGATSHSYGIEVAKLAGLPSGMIERSREILANLEKGEFDDVGQPRIAQHEGQTMHAGQLALFTAHPFVENLRDTDLSTLSPLEALNLLHKWKEKI